MLQILAQVPFPETGFTCAQDGAGFRRKAECRHPQQGHPRVWALPQDILIYKIHTLPVWEHTVITSFQAHGSGDVAGDEAGLFHGVDEVSRGLEHRVVGHEVRGSDARAVAEDVNCRAVSGVSPGRRQWYQRQHLMPYLQNLSIKAEWCHLTLDSGIRPAVNFRDREAPEKAR